MIKDVSTRLWFSLCCLRFLWSVDDDTVVRNVSLFNSSQKTSFKTFKDFSDKTLTTDFSHGYV